MPGQGGPGPVVPIHIDLSGMVRRSVASLYSHLITRPTGQALRLGIESQIGEMGDLCLSILDFTQVAILDYSCADETVAKLILRYRRTDRPADAFFMARGLGEHHLESIEEVLNRHGLALVAESIDADLLLLGDVTVAEHEAWKALESVVRGGPDVIAGRLGWPIEMAAAALETLAEKRVVVRREAAGPIYYALRGLLAETMPFTE